MRVRNFALITATVLALGSMSVAAKASSGGGGCSTTGPAPGWTQVGVLNPVIGGGGPKYTGGTLGTAVRVKLIRDSGGAPLFYVGLAGSGAGASTGTAPTVVFTLKLDGSVQSSSQIMSVAGYGTRDIEVGDVNGDGVPDFVMGSANAGVAHVFIGQFTYDPTTGLPTDYTIGSVVTINAPSGAPSYFGWRVAVGDLDGTGSDEVAISATGGGSSRTAKPGAVYIYANGNFSAPAHVIPDPANSTSGFFGSAVTIGPVMQDGKGDLIVDANGENAAYVYQNALVATTASATLSVPASGGTFDDNAGVADVTGDFIPDLVIVAGGSTQQAYVFAGPVTNNQSPTYKLLPNSNLTSGYGNGFSVGDIDGDGKADVLIGAPNSYSCSAAYQGTAYAYRTRATTFSLGTLYTDLFETPTVQTNMIDFGYSMAAAEYNSVAAQPILLIGGQGTNVGTQQGAGQVYVYRKTQ